MPRRPAVRSRAGATSIAHVHDGMNRQQIAKRMANDPQDIESELRILGRGLRELRQRAGITQRELGAHLNLKHNYISEVEGGRRSVRWITVRRILGVLGADLHQFADAFNEAEKQQPTPRRS